MINKKGFLAIDTGAGFSIVRPDLIRGAIKQLGGGILRTATGEPATIYGKSRVELRIASYTAFREFIVADIGDLLIIDADSLIRQSICLDCGRQIMCWDDLEIPLYVGYKSVARVG